MNSPNKIPRFSYNLSSPSKTDFGCIVADDVVFHRISNHEEFYRALGYTDDIRATRVLPDEFIWDTFTHGSASKSVQCLQSQIAAYLYHHSERFREEFGHEYANMIGQCLSDKVDESDLCVICPMHPSSISFQG